MKPSDHATSSVLSGTLIEEQIAIEVDSVREGINRYRDLVAKTEKRGDGPTLRPVERLIQHWYKPVVADIRAEQRKCKLVVNGEDLHSGHGRALYAPAMVAIDAPRIAILTMHAALNALIGESRSGIRVRQANYEVGNAIIAECHCDLIKRDERLEIMDLYRRWRRLDARRINYWAKANLESHVWSQRLCQHLGARLLWSLITFASVGPYTEDGFVPAFMHEKRRLKSRRDGQYRPNGFFLGTRELWEAIDDGHRQRQTLRPRYQPMIVQPYPWQKNQRGGYVKLHTWLSLRPHPIQRKAQRAADLSEVYERLNAVNAPAWRINRRVLEVMKATWDQGGHTAMIPPHDDLPPIPWIDDADDATRMKCREEMSKIHAENKRRRSVRWAFIAKMDAAEAFAGYERIYFPHQLDFRSRALPVPQPLNHQGDDVCRGLLEFADAVPLGKEGAFWIKVHAANCYGVDKVSYEDRAAWVDQHAGEIERSANDPLNEEFWRHADESKPGAEDGSPWQFLAACFALTDPKAGQRIPIQMDGTCNGLQHYAAMMRDEATARLVNLTPADKPQRAYRNVAEYVSAIVHRDAQAGDLRAMVFDGIVSDKLVKVPVMTTPYGVRVSGARQQIYDKMDEMGLTSKIDQQSGGEIDWRHRYRTAMYLSKLTIEAMQEICPAASMAMEWLRRVARMIAKGDAEKGIKPMAVSWRTPIGWPVVQHYENFRRCRVRTRLQAVNVREGLGIPAVGQQVDGIAPNFVHSLDGTHMLNTALAMREQQQDFAAVHDSYWCHAGHVLSMNRILRDEFIQIHQIPRLNWLHEQLTESYRREFPEPPQTGGLNINLVKQADYFFS